MKRNLLIVLMSVVTVFAVIGCGDEEKKNDDPKPKDGEIVVVSTWEEVGDVITIYQDTYSTEYNVKSKTVYTYAADTLNSYVYIAEYDDVSIADSIYRNMTQGGLELYSSMYEDIVCDGSVLKIVYNAATFSYMTKEFTRLVAKESEGKKIYSLDDME